MTGHAGRIKLELDRVDRLLPGFVGLNFTDVK
jgi:hypothetical protein